MTPRAAWLQDADHRHGLQMAVAVLLAYGISLALHLPEGFWAVMSTLIVMRANTGATMGAGWDRVRGTAVGTLAGLFGVWLRHQGLSLPVATLLIVAALAFGSGLVPTLRSAPITALIVVSSGGIAGHSAFAVAGLRVLEIAIGIAAGLAVTALAPSARASARFDAACAALLRQLAAQCRSTLQPERPRSGEADGAPLRIALRRLALLAMDVEREARLPWRRRAGTGDDALARFRQRAAVTGRLAQQAGAFGRLFPTSTAAQHDPLWAALREATDIALNDTAAAIAGTAAPRPAVLLALGPMLQQRWAAADGYDETAALLAGPVRLFTDDLLLLRRLQAAPKLSGS